MKRFPIVVPSNHRLPRRASRPGAALPAFLFEFLGAVVVLGAIVVTVALFGMASVDRHGAGGPDEAWFEREPIYALALSPDGRTVFSLNRDGGITLHAQDGSIEQLQMAGASPSTMAVCANGRQVVAAYYDGQIVLWSDLTGDPQAVSLGENRNHVRGLAVSPDGTLAAVADVAGYVTLLDAVHGGRVASYFAHEGGAHCVVFSPDGSQIFSGGADGMCQLRNVAGGEVIRQFEGHLGLINSVAFSPNARLAASCGLDRTVRVWDLDTGRELWHDHADLYSARTVEFSPDGRTVAVGGVDKTIKLWNTQTGRRLGVFSGHDSGISRIRFMPDSRTLVSAGYDGTIRFWDAASFRQTRIIIGD